MLDNTMLGWIANYEDRCAEAYQEVCRYPDKYHQILHKYELTESDIPNPNQKFAF